MFQKNSINILCWIPSSKNQYVTMPKAKINYFTHNWSMFIGLRKPNSQPNRKCVSAALIAIMRRSAF